MSLTDEGNKKKVELLSPAGSADMLRAVIAAGADAVYLGAKSYSARAYADNFTEEELLSAIDFCHLRGKKVYLSLNTLLRDEELHLALDLLRPLQEAGLDAVLVQDIGLLRRIREEYPDLSVFASTQMTVCGTEGVLFLQSLGVRRIVLARELSLSEVREIAKKTDAELEVFVHGAMCFSYSGQCLLSSMIGGRSGNRGRCAQPCRLPYRVSDGEKRSSCGAYPLSMKDLCCIDRLPELLSSGVSSLKIEGRMKGTAYAAGVVSVYRKAIDDLLSDPAALSDAAWDSKEEKKELLSLGSRGFTDGYLQKKNGPDMLSRQNSAFRVQKAKEEEKPDRPELSLAVHGEAAFLIGRPSSLMVSCQTKEGSFLAKSTGPAPSAAKNAPVTKERLKERLMRTGESDFFFESLTVQADQNLFVPNGAVNALRRDALSCLRQQMLCRFRRGSEKETKETEQKDSAAKAEEKQAAKAEEKQAAKAAEREGDGRNTPAQNLRLCALVSDFRQLRAVLSDGRVSRVYAETEAVPRKELLSDLKRAASLIFWTNQNTPEEGGISLYPALPAVCRNDTASFYQSIVDELRKLPIGGFLVRNIEEFSWAKKEFPEKKIILDHRLYVENDSARAFWRKQGADDYTVPLEYNRAQIAGCGPLAGEMVLYGRAPLMCSAQCVHAASGGCDQKEGTCFLTDRRGMRFPVKNFCSECQNVLYNALPTQLFSETAELVRFGIRSFRLEFSVEGEEETADVLSLLPKSFFPRPDGRDGEERHPAAREGGRPHTGGHYQRGVE